MKGLLLFFFLRVTFFDLLQKTKGFIETVQRHHGSLSAARGLCYIYIFDDCGIRSLFEKIAAARGRRGRADGDVDVEEIETSEGKE